MGRPEPMQKVRPCPAHGERCCRVCYSHNEVDDPADMRWLLCDTIADDAKKEEVTIATNGHEGADQAKNEAEDALAKAGANKTKKEEKKPDATPRRTTPDATPRRTTPGTSSSAASAGPALTTKIPEIGEMSKARPKPKGKPGSSSTPDFERRMGPNPLDPRFLGKGPCGVNHREYYEGSKAWGSWKECNRCGLRVEYVPNGHAPCNSVKQWNPVIVEAALMWMQEIGHFDSMTGREMIAVCKILEQAKHSPGFLDPLRRAAAADDSAEEKKEQQT